MSGPAQVEPLSEANRAEVEAYLARHEDSAQFLINNLREHGAVLTAHPNSGNFRAIRCDGRIAAVFCLARRGNLIVQSDADFSALVLETCAKETVPLRGFIGEWDSVAPIRHRFQAANPGYRPKFDSREILYAYPLHRDDESLVHDPRVRLLVQQDFEQWLRLGEGYIAELGVPDDLTLEQKRELFARSVSARLWWGLFGGASLLARVALNSSGPTVGQVGGVFTVPASRRQGMARAAMRHMLRDCRDVHGHTRSILFTGEADVPAQKLYEAIGYQRIGAFALILG